MKIRSSVLLLTGVLGIACAGGLWYTRQRPVAAAPSVSSTEQANRLMKEGKIAEAVVEFNRGMATTPAGPEPYIGLAVLYEAVERPDLAIETLEQLQAVNPEAPHLACRLAEAHLGAEDMQTARELSEKAVAKEPTCARAHSVAGLTMMAFRYYDNAATLLQKARQMAPDDIEIGLSLLDVTLQQAKYVQATELGEQLVAKAPDSARLHYQLGWGYCRDTHNKQATEKSVLHLKKAIELSPQWFEPQAELGRLYKSIGKNPEALACFERAWQLNSTAPGVAYNLAALWRQQGDPRADAMDKTYRRLLQGKERFTQMRLFYKSDTGNAQKAMTLAEMEARSGRQGTALYRLHKLLSAEPDNVEALKLYIRLDTQIRARSANYLRPGPGIGLPRS